MSITAAVFLAFSVLSTCIGIFVLLHSPTRAVTHAFFTLSFGISLWVGAYALMLYARNDLYLPILNGGELILIAGLVQFAHTFPSKRPAPIHPFLFWAPLICGGAGILLINSRIHHVSLTTVGTMRIVNNPFIEAWDVLLATYILISLTIFMHRYRSAHSRDRKALRLLFFGMGAFALCVGTFDILLPKFFGALSFSFLGPLSSLIFLCAAAATILRYEHLNVRVAIQRSIVYSISFFVLTLLYVVILAVLEYSTEDVLPVTAPVSAAITMLIGMYTLPHMEAFFRKASDPIFFKGGYDYFAVLEELSCVLNAHINLRPLALQSLAVLDRTFKPAFSHFIRTDSRECFLHESCALTHSSAENVSAGITIAMYSGTATIGEYVLGPKRSGSAYTREDRALIRTFAGQATVAFEKAELYQKLREYSEQLENKVHDRTRHLEELQDRQRLFFDDISHALQTPLTVLKSSLSLLQTAPYPSSRIYASMDASIDSLSRLVRGILELARIDTRPPESRVRFDLSALLSRIVEYVTVLAEAERITVSADIEPAVCIMGDKEQLEEACVNILSNAVKYTVGCVRRSIHLSLTTASASAVVCVRDSGIGMSSEQLSCVFERFYRVQSDTLSTEGFGLGLTITKRIIERHGGSIRFQSALGKGTTIYVTLPFVSPAAIHS